MPCIAEARSRDSGLGAIEQQYFASFTRQGETAAAVPITRRRSRRWYLARSCQHRIRSTILQATAIGVIHVETPVMLFGRVSFPPPRRNSIKACKSTCRRTQRVQQGLAAGRRFTVWLLMGTVGEGNSLSAEEKRAVLKGAVEVSAGKAPVIVGVSEFTTATAANFARDAESLGATGPDGAAGHGVRAHAGRARVSLPNRVAGSDGAAHHAVQTIRLLTAVNIDMSTRTSGGCRQHCRDQGVCCRLTAVSRT